MASLSRSKDGFCRILFHFGVDANGLPKRNALRVGKMSRKAGDAIKDRVEELVTAALSGSSPDKRAAAWLGELATMAPGLRKKLVKLGIAPALAGEVATPAPAVIATVAEFIDGFLTAREGNKKLKPRTLIGARQDRDSLIAFLGPDRRLDAVTEADAEDFVDWLRREGSRGKKGAAPRPAAEATIGRRVRRCSQFFRRAIREKLITDNPFLGVESPSQENEDRFHFVSRAETEQLLAACPNVEWRLIVGLSRYGGLRCPSETLALTWGDIDWARNRIRVPSPKTERHKGKAWREIPLFPELRADLEAAFDMAEPGGDPHVITGYRDASSNLRTQLLRIIHRAGLTPWERVFHNMRASRQNELTAAFPLHVVCRWIGNSAMIANKHYLSATDDHFEAAVGRDAQDDALRSDMENQELSGASAGGANLALPLKNRQKSYPGQESNL
jgi:integrase